MKYNNMKILAIIPARSNSKGLKNKNIKEIGGIPLLAHTILAAKASRYINRVVISTDSSRYKKIALRYGSEVPFLREKELCYDNVHSIEVVCDVIKRLKELENYSADIVLMLLPTSPLRSVKSIDRSIEIFLRKKTGSVVSVVESDKQLPHFRIFNGEFLKPIREFPGLNVQRQDLEKLYVLNGSIYVSTPENILRYHSFHQEKTIGFIMPKEESIDINSIADLEYARYLFNKKKKHESDTFWNP